MINYVLVFIVIISFFFQDLNTERHLKEEERRKALAAYNRKSPKSGHPTAEQRHNQLKVKELRGRRASTPAPPPPLPLESNMNNSNPNQDISDLIKVREPVLTGIVPDYDLRLFEEAQSMASEKIVSWFLIIYIIFVCQDSLSLS